jgi:hypothetical protein
MEARVRTVGGRRGQGQRQQAAQAESVLRWRTAQAGGAGERSRLASGSVQCRVGVRRGLGP